MVSRAPCACAAGTRHDITACAVEPDRAGAALALGAAFLGAGQPGVLAQRVEQGLVLARRPGGRRAVDRRLDRPVERRRWRGASARRYRAAPARRAARRPRFRRRCVRSASATSAASVAQAIAGGAAHVVDRLRVVAAPGAPASRARRARRAACRAGSASAAAARTMVGRDAAERDARLASRSRRRRSARRRRR